MKRLLLLFLVIVGLSSCSQNNLPSAGAEEEVGDVGPDFPGGMDKFFKYIRKNKTYPEQAKQENVEGKVWVSFVIDSTGYVREESVKVIKGIGHGCDKEAARLIKNSPAWIPGQVSQSKKNASTRMVLPIAFKE